MLWDQSGTYPSSLYINTALSKEMKGSHAFLTRRVHVHPEAWWGHMQVEECADNLGCTSLADNVSRELCLVIPYSLDVGILDEFKDC